MDNERSLWDEERDSVMDDLKEKQDLREEAAAEEAEAEEAEQPMNLVAEEKQDPIFARIVSADKIMVSTKLAEYDAKAIEVANNLAIEVKDQATYDLATLNFAAGKNFVEEVSGYIEPARSVAWNLYQKVINRKKAILDTVERNVKAAGQNILQFERAAAERDRLAQIELDRKAKEEEETRRLNLAAAAEKAGMSTESVERILDTPSTAPRPVAAPTLRPSFSMGKTREAWKAEPVDDNALLTLVKAAAKKDGKHLLAYLQINESALNAHARATKTAMQIPGYKAVDGGTLVRARS